MADANANLISAITSGCAEVNPILVAADADAHNAANNNPAITHLSLALVLNIYCKLLGV